MNSTQTSTDEPADVQEARALIRKWELRLGHNSYVDCLEGGHKGYQAGCWDCDWRGPEHLRGDEPLGTDESREHKRLAKSEAFAHERDTMPRHWREP